MFAIIVLWAQLSAAPGPVQAAYQKLTSAEIEAKRTTSKPPKSAHRIDVSERIRSMSFGHRTWIIIAPDGKEFWIEWGRSTNRAGGLFGPFAVATNATAPTTPSPPTAPPPATRE